MVQTNNPIIFLIITITIMLGWAIIILFRYLRGKEKPISHILAASVVALFMGTIGALLGILTNSGALLTTIYAIGLFVMGTIIYATMELIEKIRKS